MNINKMVKISKSLQFLVIFTLLAPGLVRSEEKKSDLYDGIGWLFEKKENYKSIFDGEISYLVAGGHDEFHDASDSILVSGKISKETVINVVNILNKRNIKVIYFDSPGGDLIAGLELGKIINKNGLNTSITKNAKCMSACALAFLAGTIRTSIGDPAKLGFHRQYYIIKNKIIYGDYKKDLKEIDYYLKEINFKDLSAQEIVSTTGLLSFSKSALVDRNIINRNEDDVADFFKYYLNFTGLSFYEKIQLMCEEYKTKKELDSSLSDNIYYLQNFIDFNEMVKECGSFERAFREPMIYFVLNTNSDVSLKNRLSLIKKIKELLKKNGNSISDLEANFSREGEYEKYIDKRREFASPRGAEEP